MIDHIVKIKDGDLARYFTLEEAALPRPSKEIVVSKKDIGERVRTIRQARDLSQSQLASLLGIPTTNVSAIERGIRGLSLQQLAKLTTALGVSPGDILTGPPMKSARTGNETRLPRRLERIRGLPRTKRRVLYEIIDAFLEKHGPG